MNNIQTTLFNLQDKEYREFQAKLIPNIDKNSIIGIRTPEIRKIAKELISNNDFDEFLKELPHKYFDENQLHSLTLSFIKDFDTCLNYVNEFLPFIDNWANCDGLSPKIFKKYHKELLPYIKGWLGSKQTYTVRFGIKMLMEHYLDEDYKIEYSDMVAEVASDEYYVNMMRAWYFATALCKQYKSIIPYIQEKRLDRWTHNKTIQKAIESYRITDTQKKILKELKI